MAEISFRFAKKGDGYLEVESVEKHFPNKITVSLSEKYEVFAFLNETDGKYYVVGDDRTVLAVKEDNTKGSTSITSQREAVWLG